jgi:hypothetical protein
MDNKGIKSKEKLKIHNVKYVKINQSIKSRLHAWSPQPQIVFHRTEEAGDLPRR